MYAARDKHHAVVRLLVSRGADVNFKDYVRGLPQLKRPTSQPPASD